MLYHGLVVVEWLSSPGPDLNTGDFDLNALCGGFIEEQSALAKRALVHVRRGRHGRGVFGLLNVLHPKAKVVQPRSMLREPFPQRMVRCQRLDKLQVSVAQIQVSKPNGVFVDVLAIEHFETENIAPEPESFLGVRNDNRQMIKPGEAGQA